MLRSVDAILRGEARFAAGSSRPTAWPLLLALGTGGFLYGGAMGIFGKLSLQAVYSGVKVPLLLVVSTLICLPNFYIVNALLGLRDDFGAAVRGLLSAQATLALCLAGLAPLTVVFYVSTDHDPSRFYRPAIALNGLFFALATLGAQMTLRRHYAPLIRKNPRHRWARRAWIVLYVFVAVQLAWLLRPFIGSPSLQPQFFRDNAFSENAYVVVGRLVVDVIGRILRFE